VTDGPQWNRVKELFQEALERPPQERMVWLRQRCDGDRALVAEVESLLVNHQEAGSFGEQPAMELLGSLDPDEGALNQRIRTSAGEAVVHPGDRLGAYEIRALIGAGGMGEVYRARDTKLGRDVAIKVLPSSFTADRDRLARFEREARMLASLSHPHIAAIHGLEERDGIRALVLELIEGETLAARLVRGPLPPAEALALGVQIAEALDHAHRHGVTHRDLKPSNIMLTKAGAKLLDFGLAKWSRPVRATASVPTMHDVSSVTNEGAIVGTLGYMSPEQLEGRNADARSDLFAFGAVLYEMLTGRQAFGGPNQASVIAAILTSQPPPPSEIAPQVPPRLDRVVAKSLARDQDVRWQTSRDLADELKWILDDVGRAGSSAPAVAAGKQSLSAVARLTLLSALATVIVAAVAWRVGSLRNESAARAVTRFVVEPSLMRPGAAFDISPDGSQLAYVAREAPGQPSRFFLRRLDQFEAAPLPGTERAIFPIFSEDGQWISFSNQFRRIEKINVRTVGAPLLLPIFDRDECNCRDFFWTGDTVYFMRIQHGIQRVGGDGGQPIEVTKLGQNPPEVDHHSPELLPGGRALLFAIHQGVGRFAVAVQILASGDRKVLVNAAFDPHYLPSGHLMYATGHTIVAAPFDANRLELTGPAVTLVEDVGTFPEDGVGSYRLAKNGTLVFMPHRSQAGRSLVSVDRSGKETPIPIGVRSIVDPRLSPDGRLLAFAAGTDDRRDIWLYELASEKLTRITSEGDSHSPVWTPDGRKLTYGSARGTIEHVFWQPIDSSGPAQSLVTSSNRLWPAAWTPDGRLLLYWDEAPTSFSRSYFISVDGDRTPQPLFPPGGNPMHFTLSPNGRWVAFMSDETGRTEVYVAPFPALNTRHQLTVEGGHQPRWSRDGRQLFYRWGDGVFAVPVDTGSTFSAGKPARLFELERSVRADVSYDADATGGRFVMLKTSADEQASPRLNVVLNWTDELMRRVPTK